MGARSSFESWAEHAVLRLGIIAARIGLPPGVPDISVGPFQMRPSSAFGWERAQVPFGHVAMPARTADGVQSERCAELLSASTAILLLMDLLASPDGRAEPCDSLSRVYPRYRGRGFEGLETDHAVLARIHDALHSNNS